MFREIPRFPPLRRFRLILTFLELVSLNKSSTSDEWDCNSCNISSTPTGGDILLAIGRELDDSTYPVFDVTPFLGISRKDLFGIGERGAD